MMNLHHMTRKKFERNLTSIYQASTREEREEGRRWYSEAHDWAELLSHMYGFKLYEVAAVCSALSPAVSWDVNKRDTQTLIHNFADGKTLGDFKVSTYGQNKTKAWKILEESDPSLLGKGLKTNAFWGNIIKPYDYNCVTIDRHAYKAIHGLTEGGGVSIPESEYLKAQRGYQICAQNLGLIPNQLQAIIWLTYKRLHNR